MECLEKDKDDMLAFMVFQKLIGSIYRTQTLLTRLLLRLPQDGKTLGYVAGQTIFTLGQSTQKRWRSKSFRLLAGVIRGVQLKDGEPVASRVAEEPASAVI